MFFRIVVAVNHLIESQRALRTAIFAFIKMPTLILVIGLHQHDFYLSRL